MNFGCALNEAKTGKRIRRQLWPETVFVVYQKGYPEGIPCNKQTADAWKMNEGDLFRCDPYLQIGTEYGSHQMWMPNMKDLLADDWITDIDLTT